MTRLDVIKILADKMGAHVDCDIHPFMELIETSNVMPLKVVVNDNNGERECEVNCSNLLSETVYSIAKELIYSFNYVYYIMHL